ncbi:MAG: GDP-L-fucose synthase [Desulfobacterales bacterium]|nr:GDP-L-fucose synthase [Desulfobacterales bacterium]
MNKSDKIFVAGATGMVGSAILRRLSQNGYTNIIGSYNSKPPLCEENNGLKFLQLDLKDQDGVNRLFRDERPAYVFLAAARVGGIHANDVYPADFIYDNLAIQTHIIHAAYEHKVQRLLFLGSSCIYPKKSPQPMREDYLLSGHLEPTNEPYAIAKIAGIKMCESYNRQYGTRFLAVMPTNLYGPNDNFDLETSHVLPALIRKFHEAKLKCSAKVVIWGTGSPRREFLHVDDMADGCIHVMTLPDRDVDKNLTQYPTPCFVNLGTGKDCTIKELAQIVKETVGFKGLLEFDVSRPDGTPRKLLNVTRLSGLGWESKIQLKDGIAHTYEWFIKNQVRSD